MTKVEQYVATRIEHIKRQVTHGEDKDETRRKSAEQWELLFDAEKREAEPAYFAASLQYERTRPR